MNNKVNTMLCMYDSATDPYIISYNNNKSYHNATSIIKKRNYYSVDGVATPQRRSPNPRPQHDSVLLMLPKKKETIK